MSSLIDTIANIRLSTADEYGTRDVSAFFALVLGEFSEDNFK